MLHLECGGLREQKESDMRGRRILFIDDEPFEMSSIRDALEFDDRYEIRFAVTGDEAFEAISDGDFDVVILDIMMPAEKGKEVPENSRKTGLRIAEALREAFPAIPIICLSVVNDRQVKKRMRDLDIIYIEKPALPSVVLSEVESIPE